VDEHTSSYDFDNYIEAAFQLATYQGPMCGEPVEGLAYFLDSLEIDGEAIEQEIGMDRRH
jgi:ribosome assembly protein 1